MTEPNGRRALVSWALYDWANSAFATTVMAAFFPMFFKQYWGGSTWQLGVTIAWASLAVLLLSPVLGAIADAGGLRKRLLAGFALLGIGATGALWFVPRGAWPAAAALYACANVGYLGANVFYDALVVEVAPERKRDSASALGYSLGYLGGGLLFLVQVVALGKPEWFGFAAGDKATVVRTSFASVAIWWAVFSLPLLAFVRERAGAPEVGRAVRAGFRQLLDTVRHVSRLRVVALFLVAYWFYIDAVNTIIVMATDYGLSVGLEPMHLMLSLLLTQFIGFPAAIVFGRLGERAGAKRGIQVGLWVYAGIIVLASLISRERPWLFFVLAGLVGLVQGGVQALSRSLYSRLVPPDRATEFFGFYNMIGKFAALLGPLLVGSVSALSGTPQYSILAVALLLLPGVLLLSRVDVERGAAIARGSP